MHHFSTLEI